jgi:hypothetical protein
MYTILEDGVSSVRTGIPRMIGRIRGPSKTRTEPVRPRPGHEPPIAAALDRAEKPGRPAIIRAEA